jgi:small subunit ribosomal protein S4
MSRYCGAVCRLCRREGAKLYLKGERCFSSKCAIERRPGAAPGVHGKARKSSSNYNIRLREKQKAKRIFGLTERKMRKYFKMASRQKGVTGSQMLALIERRLDNVVYHLGYGHSRAMSRQLVTHGHIQVNGERVDKPSFTVNVGDIVGVSEKLKSNPVVLASLQAATSRIVPNWLELDRASTKGKINAMPSREQMVQDVREQLIVELYSK